jgi:large subunit ribosomal protein L2
MQDCFNQLSGWRKRISPPRGLKVGETVLAAPNASILIGNCLPFQSIPLGTSVHNVELTPGCGGQLARAAA